jgi:hypothetical protein
VTTTESCEERGQSRHQAMQCNAAWPLYWGAGPPLGYEAAPDRAVRRLNLGANLRDCGHARLVWIGRNETRVLSLMSVAEVNSGTRTASGEQVNAALRELQERAAGAPFSYCGWIAPAERWNSTSAKAAISEGEGPTGHHC